MKGLLIKDLCLIWKTSKMFILMLCVIFAFSAISPMNLNMYCFAFVLIGILTNSLMGIEERDGSDKYFLFLPVSRKLIVAEKYVLSALLISVPTLLMIAIEFINSTPLMQIAVMVLIAIVFGLVFPIICLPLTFRFGFFRARVVFICFGGLLGAGSAFIMSSSVFLEIFSIEEFSKIINLQNLSAVTLLVLILYVVSFLLSVKLYQKRDF